MKKVINDLMQKDMSRKEFLGTLGFGLISIFGFSGLVKMLTERNSRASSGYGSSKYGGNKSV